MNRKIRTLVVDDSAMVRAILSRGLNQDEGIEVVGVAVDPYDARNQILQLRPDVITLDVEMPRMNGIEFLRRLMPQYPMPVVMVSSLTQEGQAVTLEALHLGAVDFVSKPSGMGSAALEEMLSDLRGKVKVAAQANVSHWKKVSHAVSLPAPPIHRFHAQVIAIGASTGGVEALQTLLSGLPLDCPGVVVAQHMLPGFTHTFARRLDECCALSAAEACDGDPVESGRILIAPGDRHLLVERRGGQLFARVSDAPPYNRHRPSVDLLMRSVAQQVGEAAVGVLLTGMGRDGAEGLLEMRRAGGRTLTQDEASSVIYGMPRAAVEIGAAEKELPLVEIASVIIQMAGKL